MGLVTPISRRRLIGRLAAAGASAAGLVLLGGCALGASTSKLAKVPRVGLIGPSPDAPWVQPLWAGLRELGWVEGQNFSVERRDQTSATDDQISADVAGLLAMPVDVLVTSGTSATLAAKQATQAIPIVFANVSNPVGVGVVASLAQPGGNVTGVSNGASTPLSGKLLELLRAIVPGLAHLAVIYDVTNPVSNALTLAERQEAAGPLGVQVRALYFNSADDLASAFATAASWPAHGVIVAQSALLLSERARIAELAARSHLPAMYGAKEFVEAGGLMSYGTSLTGTFQRAAIYVDKILRGARPADLPVEQITTLEFAVNVKTAQALGLTLPPDVAAQVTEWVP
jgi:putative ABC transport system substrate-binding protein